MFTSCGRGSAAKAGDEAVLAVVGDVPIVAGDFREAMLRRGGSVPGVFASEDNRRALLEEMVAFEIMKARAREAGYYDNPEIRESLDKMVVTKFYQDAVQGRAAELELTDRDVETYYQEHAEEFRTPEEVRAALVFIEAPASRSADERARLEAKAESVRQEVLALDAGLPHLGDVAVRNSDDQATRYRGGDIGWLVRGKTTYRWDKDVLAAIYSLRESGDVTPVIATDSGFYVARVTGARDSAIRPLEEVGSLVRIRLAAERKAAVDAALADEMRKGMRISVDGSLLAAIAPPEGTSTAGLAKQPPAFPGGVN